MKIKSFKIDYYKENWHLGDTRFNDINLLVGISGTGKTKILRALNEVCGVGRGDDLVNGVCWKINFVHSGQEYEWELKSEIPNENPSKKSSTQPEVVYEKLTRINKDGRKLFLDRSQTEFTLNESKLPKLKKTESAIALLSEKEAIAPVYEAFNSFVFDELSQDKVPVFRTAPYAGSTKGGTKTDKSFELFTKNFIKSYIAIKAWFMQHNFPSHFNEVKQYYLDIFPNIEDIRVKIDSSLGFQEEHHFYFELKEAALERWVQQDEISSGMFRVLLFLMETYTAPKGSVIVIDEFENSLGINCMPELTDFIVNSSAEKQFILTSHHPYVIHNIPWKKWQIVSRKGSCVTVKQATEIQELNTASSLDKFTQLVSLPQYEDGIE
ncbi:MAG: ATP-binding protein [Gammaproteobacteria bacterium]|nr:ATP-binding protein [Gammaproteobacteria bacterium]